MHVHVYAVRVCLHEYVACLFVAYVYMHECRFACDIQDTYTYTNTYTNKMERLISTGAGTGNGRGGSDDKETKGQKEQGAGGGNQCSC